MSFSLLVVVVRWVMWEPPFFGGFQGLWEGWDGFIVPRFPSDRHFHRLGASAFFDEVWPVDARGLFLIAGLLAVGHHLRLALEFLLCLHERQRMTESLVLDDRSCG